MKSILVVLLATASTSYADDTQPTLDAVQATAAASAESISARPLRWFVFGAALAMTDPSRGGRIELDFGGLGPERTQLTMLVGLGNRW